ncbi:NAD(P)-binding domain-containing protein [Neobacillus sp. PS3-34]|uniref:NADPH-dependent F420 reductase n=1 Tax=Neobacillus sp. PS3-34 TaxID=3070678 RepID=UPI0027E0FBD1|nr:NAD(P)-binding domain-containing protein [Neobacillus sp. PS3-34]WML49496.1 NAD(P)-binding domain-containing protein [Neobacillus sp. PS3-34]
MKVSVIGTGRMGKGIITTVAPIVDELLWASRNEDRVHALIEENKFTDIVPVSYEEALQADIIIPALLFRDLIPWAKENSEKLEGKILVDITNPFTEDFTDFTLKWGQSAAEELQKVVPEANIVGAFKNTYFQVFYKPIYDGVKSDVYITSDHPYAKEIVMNLLKPSPFRILDGGMLKNNRIIERFTLFEREMAIRYGNYPYISNRLFGLKAPAEKPTLEQQ